MYKIKTKTMLCLGENRQTPRIHPYDTHGAADANDNVAHGHEEQLADMHLPADL